MTFRDCLKRLFPAPNRRPIRNADRLRVEPLEDRTQPSAYISFVGTTLVYQASFTGPQVANELTIDWNSATNEYTFTDRGEPVYQEGVPVARPVYSQTVPGSMFASLEVRLGGGNDTLDLKASGKSIRALGEAGEDTFNVQSTTAETLTILDLGLQADTVNISPVAKSLAAIAGQVVVLGDGGARGFASPDKLVVNDDSGGGGHYYLVNAPYWTGVPAVAQPGSVVRTDLGVAVNFTGLNNVTVHGGTGSGDQFLVSEAALTTPRKYGLSADPPELPGTGRGIATVEDVVQPAAPPVGSPPITDPPPDPSRIYSFSFDQMDGVQFNTGDQGSRIEITVVASSLPVTISAGSGNDSIFVGPGALGAILSPVEISAGGGDDAVTVGTSGFMGQIRAPVTIHGGSNTGGNAGGRDTLRVNNSGSSDAMGFTLSPGQVLRDASPGVTAVTVSYDTVEAVTLDGTNGTGTYTVTGTSPGVETTINAGPAADTFLVGTADPTGTVNGVASRLNLNGGLGANTLTLNDAGDTMANRVSVIPVAGQPAVDIGARAGTDTFFGTGGTGGSVRASGFAGVTLNLGAGADTADVTPDAGAAITVNGNAPGTSPGDTLTLDRTGITPTSFPAAGATAGTWTFTNRQPVSYTGIESPPSPPAVPPPPVPTRYDFGTATSPAQTLYTRVSAGTRYTAAAGYGWESGVVFDVDRGTANPLTRDCNYTHDPNGVVFRVDIPNGTYTVTVGLGDSSFPFDFMGVSLQGGQVDNVTTVAGGTTRPYTVTVTGGVLRLGLKDLGGTNPDAVIYSLDIASVARTDVTGPRVVSATPTGTVSGPVSSVTLTFDERVAADTFGMGDVTITGPGGASITPTAVTPVSATQYTVTFPSQSAPGLYTLTVGPDIRDLAGGNPMNQNGNGTNGQAGVAPAGDGYPATFTIPSVVRPTHHFDFGTGTSPVATGYLRVDDTPASLYPGPGTTGYGWVSLTGVVAVNRGTGNDLNRDFCYVDRPGSAEFRVNLPDGMYRVDVGWGDTEFDHDQMGVSLEGGAFDSVTTTPSMRTFVKPYTVMVTGGALNLVLQDQGGTNLAAVIYSLDITPV